MLRYLTIFFIVLLTAQVSWGQETLSLEEAIHIARENSLRIRQGHVNMQQAQVSLSQARHARYPNLNLGSGFSYNLGRSVNPVTYQFETNEFSYTNFSASTGITIFNGNRINNTIQQTRLSFQAARESLQQESDDVALEVALGFLNLLFAEENLANAESQLKTSQTQLDQVVKSIEAGARPLNDRYELDAQVALREQNLTQQKNAVRLAQLNLQQLLLWDGPTPIQIERPNIDALITTVPGSLDPDHIFSQALVHRHDIKAASLNKSAAMKGIGIAKSGYWPSLNVGLSTSSGFTDLAEAPTNFDPQLTSVPGVFIDGEAVNFQTIQVVPTDFQKVKFVDQLDQNLSMGLSVNLSIPIYNRRSVKSSVEQARLQYESSLITEESTQQLLRQSIQQAVADYEGARDNLDAQQKTVRSLEAAYQAAIRRYEVGQGNAFELANAKNQLDAAANQLIIAKFDCVFKMKVIDFYLGRGLGM